MPSEYSKALMWIGLLFVGFVLWAQYDCETWPNLSWHCRRMADVCGSSE